MKVLGIVCSPRARGNTEILVRKVLESAKKEGAKVESWSIVGKELKPCNHCENCLKTKECTTRDDMQSLYPKIVEADGIVIGSPVYFYSVSAQAKLVIDRMYAFRFRPNRLSGRVGGAVTVARRRGDIETLSVINNFFLGMGVTPVGLGVAGRGDKRGDVNGDERALIDATALGKRIVEVISQYKGS